MRRWHCLLCVVLIGCSPSDGFYERKSFQMLLVPRDLRLENLSRNEASFRRSHQQVLEQLEAFEVVE